jgi:hypothetical protein
MPRTSGSPVLIACITTRSFVLLQASRSEIPVSAYYLRLDIVWNCAIMEDNQAFKPEENVLIIICIRIGEPEDSFDPLLPNYRYE